MTPVVKIAGEPIAVNLDDVTTTRAALAGIDIRWGRESITDLPAPQASQLTLIDLDLSAAQYRNSTFIGKTVEVWEGKTRLLSGTITAQDPRRRSLTLANYRKLEVIEWQLTATDLWGVLETIRPAGTWNGAPLRATGGAVYGSTMLPWGAGGWGQQFSTDRLRDVGAAISSYAKLILPTETWSAPADSLSNKSAPRSTQRGIKAGELVSAAELVRRGYAATAPLGFPDVDTAGNIRQGTPAQAKVIQLKSNGTRITLDTGGAINVSPEELTISDAEHALPNSTAEQRAAFVTLNLQRVRRTYLDKLVNAKTGETLREESVVEDDNSTELTRIVPGAASSSTTVSVDALPAADVIIPRPDGDTASAPAGANEGYDAAFANLSASADLLGVLNDSLVLPQIVWRGSTENELLRTSSLGTLVLLGNKFATWDRVPAQYQLIGGELRWDGKEWQHALRLAPAIDRARRVLTTQEVFGAITRAPLSGLDKSINLLDLALLSKESAET